MSVLCYDFIEGASYMPTVSGWLLILKQVKAKHSIDLYTEICCLATRALREGGWGFHY